MRLLLPTSVALRPARRRALPTLVWADTSLMIGGDVTAAEKFDTNVLSPAAPLYWLALMPPTSAGAATVAVASYSVDFASVAPATSSSARAGTRTRTLRRRLAMSR